MWVKQAASIRKYNAYAISILTLTIGTCTSGDFDADSGLTSGARHVDHVDSELNRLHHAEVRDLGADPTKHDLREQRPVQRRPHLRVGRDRQRRTVPGGRVGQAERIDEKLRHLPETTFRVGT